MAEFNTVQELQRSLIRKALNGSVFKADITDDTDIDEATLFTTGTGAFGVLPAGYVDLGLLSDAGAAFSRSVDTSNVTSWQRTTPSRTDVTSDVTTLAVVCQETKLATIGLYTGADESAIIPAANGVVRIDKPETPEQRSYRIISISEDKTNAGEIYICRYLPNAQVSDFDSQAYAKGDDPVEWPVTFTGYVDDDLGASESWIFGGIGWKALLADMGFDTGS